MKYILIFIFLIFSSFVSATTYYISPNGNDNNAGTISSPFFTLNKAWSVIKAGDIIYARGGIYRFSSRQTLTGKNGTSSDTIRVWAYPGERPVFTKSSNYANPGWPASLIYLDADYTHWKSIEIAYYTQATPAIWYGMAALGSNHNKFERINSHHNGHGMVLRDESSNNLILNCDFHHNYDPLTTGDAYGNADGLEVGYQSGSVENTIKGCRLWANSDDGIDLWSNNGNVIIEGCWAWKNGYKEDGVTPGGDGGGLKFGATTTATGTEFKRTVKNCMSVYNRSIGFNQNAADVKFYFYNNIAYKNNLGIVFYSYDLPNIYRNNASFGNSNENWTGPHSNAIRDHNTYDASWQPGGPVASAADYISVDTTGISGSRQPDGSLPNISFLKLAPGSDLIDAGVNVGNPYNGNAPDIGPFETQTSSSSPSLTYLNSVVENSAPNKIGINFNLPLANSVPPGSAFLPKVNGITRPVNSVTVSGNRVDLTLQTNVVQGDIVTIAYTKPPSNPLQAVSGLTAENITNQPVINNIQGFITNSSDTANYKKDISIYPNPAKEYLNISNLEPSAETQIIRIFDFSGKLCLEVPLNAGISNKIPLNLKTGMYIIQIVLGPIVKYAQKLVVI